MVAPREGNRALGDPEFETGPTLASYFSFTHSDKIDLITVPLDT